MQLCCKWERLFTCHGREEKVKREDEDIKLKDGEANRKSRGCKSMHVWDAWDVRH